jgi:hypothetical protein
MPALASPHVNASPPHCSIASRELRPWTIHTPSITGTRTCSAPWPSVPGYSRPGPCGASVNATAGISGVKGIWYPPPAGRRVARAGGRLAPACAPGGCGGTPGRAGGGPSRPCLRPRRGRRDAGSRGRRRDAGARGPNGGRLAPARTPGRAGGGGARSEGAVSARCSSWLVCDLQHPRGQGVEPHWIRLYHDAETGADTPRDEPLDLLVMGATHLHRSLPPEFTGGWADLSHLRSPRQVGAALAAEVLGKW